MGADYEPLFMRYTARRFHKKVGLVQQVTNPRLPYQLRGSMVGNFLTACWRPFGQWDCERTRMNGQDG